MFEFINFKIIESRVTTLQSYIYDQHLAFGKNIFGQDVLFIGCFYPLGNSNDYLNIDGEYELPEFIGLDKVFGVEGDFVSGGSLYSESLENVFQLHQSSAVSLLDWLRANDWITDAVIDFLSVKGFL